MKATNLQTPSGNPAPNQIILTNEEQTTFQSYGVTVARITADGKVYLDSTYWNYSKTTSKYLSIFLGEPSATIRQKAASGLYTFTDLNKD